MKLTIKSMYIWAAATLMGLAACTEDVSVDAVFITAAEKSPVTNFSVKQEGDALGITVSSADSQKRRPDRVGNRQFACGELQQRAWRGLSDAP